MRTRINQEMRGMKKCLPVLLLCALFLTACSKPPKDLAISDSIVKAKAYYKAETIETIDMADTVTEIGQEAFASCENLRSVKFSMALREIGEKAFQNCAGLQTIQIPDSVATVQFGAFENCTGLTELILSGNAAYEGPFFGCTNVRRLTITGDHFKGTLVTSLNLRYPDADQGVRIRETLENVTIGGSVTAIPESAFSECEKLQTVSLSDRVTEIGDGAFSGCAGISSIEFPSSLKKIGANSFYKTGLTSLSIETPITSIGVSAFGRCQQLESVSVQGPIDSVGAGAFFQCEQLESVLFQGSVNAIGDRAFSGCSKLKSLEIPDNIGYMGKEVFKGCNLLKNQLLSIFPDADELKPDGAESVQRGRDKLIPDGARVFPLGMLTKDEFFDNELYNLMPEDVRTVNWATADYALVKNIDHVKNGWTVITVTKYGTSINDSTDPYYGYYLYGRDGSIRLIYRNKIDDSPEEVWEKIKDRF